MPASSKKRSTANRARSTGRSPNRSNSDAIALLKQDHQMLLRLLKRLESNGGKELLEQIDNEIKVHTQIEEEIFYPAFKDSVHSSKNEHLYYEALEEHHVVDMVLSELMAETEGPEQFDAKAKVLRDLIDHHVEEEETQMFPKARKAMGMAMLRDVGEELHERKAQLMGRNTAAGKLKKMLEPMRGEDRGGRRKRAA